ncbi:MAG: cytochrome c3 family protein [Desulfobacca sp.]|uniref:cytochrome c3 family protein n=1 Tax=Desulfobacca sp. TaxID=2067990 RepID=UPI00404B5B09
MLGKGLQALLPLECAACHGAEAQAQLAQKNQELVAKLPGGEVPRLLRGQPNATLVRYEGKVNGGPEGQGASLPPVPFNHQAHEQYTDSCRVCHHASMASCSTCHTRGGSDKGGFVTFEQAMHRRTAEGSCIGCHQAQQQTANCAGCHNSIVQARPANLAQCQLCHMPGATAAATPQQKAAVAESLLQSRRRGPDPFLTAKLPDKVVIKELSNKFQPVELDHAKHLAALQKGMQDSKLASYFHSLPGTVCQACHHNSPAAAEPPACVACHAKTQGVAAASAAEISRPGLQAAYHGQCMSCHKDMGIKPVATACTECHQKKPQHAALSR